MARPGPSGRATLCPLKYKWGTPVIFFFKYQAVILVDPPSCLGSDAEFPFPAYFKSLPKQEEEEGAQREGGSAKGSVLTLL